MSGHTPGELPEYIIAPVSAPSHTPSPWTIGGVFNPGTPDAHASIWGARPPGCQSGDQVAQFVHPKDARLIAASPDLLAALKRLMPTNVCTGNTNVPDSTVLPMDVTMGELRQAAAAIAKATGAGGGS